MQAGRLFSDISRSASRPDVLLRGVSRWECSQEDSFSDMSRSAGRSSDIFKGASRDVRGVAHSVSQTGVLVEQLTSWYK